MALQFLYIISHLIFLRKLSSFCIHMYVARLVLFTYLFSLESILWLYLSLKVFSVASMQFVSSVIMLLFSMASYIMLRFKDFLFSGQFSFFLQIYLMLSFYYVVVIFIDFVVYFYCAFLLIDNEVNIEWQQPIS